VVIVQEKCKFFDKFISYSANSCGKHTGTTTGLCYH